MVSYQNHVVMLILIHSTPEEIHIQLQRLPLLAIAGPQTTARSKAFSVNEEVPHMRIIKLNW